MRYVLLIGLEAQIYKNPKIEISVDGQLVDIIDLDHSYTARSVTLTKQNIFDRWTSRIHPDSQVEQGHGKTYDIPYVKKYLVYELDDQYWKNEDRLSVKFVDCTTNNTNGFITKMDKCTIINLMLMPKKYASIDGLYDFIQLCTDRNIYVDVDIRGWGWPSARGNGVAKEDVICNYGLNKDLETSIIYDSKLDMHMLGWPNWRDFENTNLFSLTQPLKLNEDYERLMSGAIPAVLQPDLKCDSDTSFVTLNGQTILFLERIQDKYLHNEDQRSNQT
jgi:hypothetical protein